MNARHAIDPRGDTWFPAEDLGTLQAGASKHHKGLLAPFGLDPSDPKFWDKGLGMIAGFIDELGGME